MIWGGHGPEVPLVAPGLKRPMRIAFESKYSVLSLRDVLKTVF